MWKTLEKCVYTVLKPQVSVTFKWNTKSEDTAAFKAIIGPNGLVAFLCLQIGFGLFSSLLENLLFSLLQFIVIVMLIS